MCSECWLSAEISFSAGEQSTNSWFLCVAWASHRMAKLGSQREHPMSQYSKRPGQRFPVTTLKATESHLLQSIGQVSHQGQPKLKGIGSKLDYTS